MEASEFLNSLVIRRSDLDDTDNIEQLAGVQDKRAAAARFFGVEVNIPKLIETSYLSVTALDENVNVLAFAVFDDYPPGLHSNDSQHENLWEPWFTQARGVNDEMNSHNTLWLKYFVVGNSPPNLHSEVLVKILQSAYSSLPTVKGTMLLARGNVEEGDYELTGFNLVFKKFEEMDLYHRETLSQVQGVHFDSKFYYSDKTMAIPYMEVRIAREEDHDDLASVFNSQSDVMTETYGDYFIAELIAAQNESSRSLVAQVGDKAVGMLSITSEIDTQLLWQCFELDPYDNLYDPKYMDIVRIKREEIIERRRKEAEERARLEAKKLREETMICNIIAQRMALQEALLARKDEILDELEELITNAENYQMDTMGVEKLVDKWLENYTIRQPSEYFLDHPSDDTELICNTLSEQEFFLSCLEFFGLPEGYMERKGHYVDWYKKIDEKNKEKEAQLGSLLGKSRKRDPRKNEKAAQEPKILQDPPEYFDLEPLKNALTAFFKANSDSRTQARQQLIKNKPKLEYAFRKEDGKVDPESYLVNTTNFAVHLEKAGLGFEPETAEVLGPMLRCFGLMETQDETKTIPPPQPVEEEKKAPAKNTRTRGKAQQEKEQKVQMSQEIESGVVVEFQKNKYGELIPATATLMKTSLNEVLKAVNLIEDYDTTMYDLGVVSGEELQKEAQIEEESPRKSSAEQEEPQEPQEPQELHEQKDETLELSQAEEAEEDDLEVLYKETVQDLDDLEYIPEPPEIAKNAFCLVLFCMDEAFESFGIDFLEEAFAQFPDRDYMVITQPHTVQENSLMKFFTHVIKKPNNTFSHVLYIMHRDALMYKDLEIRHSKEEDLNNMDYLLSILDQPEEILNKARSSITESKSEYASFTVTCHSEIIGLFVVSKDVNLKYYESHFHIQEHIILDQHDRSGHTKLYHAIVNPVFLSCQNLILKDILRLMNKTCLYFEIHDMTVMPDIFNHLIYTRSRRFPHFLEKPWDHEKDPSQIFKDPSRIDAERNYQDEKESDFALCFITKKQLSEPKVRINHRIVVVGASDTGISFIESLLSNIYLEFTNVYLLAPGGLVYNHVKSEHESMKASSTSYSLSELRRLLLENRVTVIDSRMLEIDRKDKKIILHDETTLRYDMLVLTMGLQDCELQEMGRVSRGIAPIPENKVYTEGVISIDDPYLYQHFRLNGNIMAALTHKKKPGAAVVYGFTLNAYCFVQGLLEKGISPSRIKLVVPTPKFEYDEGVNPLFGGDENILPNSSAFMQDEVLEEKIKNELQKLGVEVFYPAYLKSINKDQKTDALDSVVILQENQEIKINCKVLVTSGKVDVDSEIYNSIHNNGLVFNGRIIVNNQFLTTDPSIFAAGSLCEFSQDYKNIAPSRCLRMDRYNGREVGLRLSRSVISNLNLDSLEGLFDEVKEEIPYFYMPRAKGGVLPGNSYYYYILAPKFADPKQFREKPKNREDIVSDTIEVDEQGNMKGHYIKFTFSNSGVVESVTYFSKESVEVQSLWRFVGLSESYLNNLSARFGSNLLPDVAEFLSENWAMALYHDWFAEFSNTMKTDLKDKLEDVLKQVEELAENGEEMTREQILKLKELVPKKVQRKIQEKSINYIKSNLNHLPMYYIPGVEFP